MAAASFLVSAGFPLARDGLFANGPYGSGLRLGSEARRCWACGPRSPFDFPQGERPLPATSHAWRWTCG